MILMEEGGLALNDPVEKLCRIQNDEQNAGRHNVIRIRHLLTHTAGLPLYRLPESEEIAIKRNRL